MPVLSRCMKVPAFAFTYFNVTPAQLTQQNN
jgi:hypothetical protein